MNAGLVEKLTEHAVKELEAEEFIREKGSAILEFWEKRLTSRVRKSADDNRVALSTRRAKAAVWKKLKMKLKTMGLRNLTVMANKKKFLETRDVKMFDKKKVIKLMKEAVFGSGRKGSLEEDEEQENYESGESSSENENSDSESDVGTEERVGVDRSKRKRKEISYRLESSSNSSSGSDNDDRDGGNEEGGRKKMRRL